MTRHIRRAIHPAPAHTEATKLSGSSGPGLDSLLMDERLSRARAQIAKRRSL